MQTIYYVGNEQGQLVLRVSLPEFTKKGQPLGKIISSEMIIDPSECDGPEKLAEFVKQFSQNTGIIQVSDALAEFLPANFSLK